MLHRNTRFTRFPWELIIIWCSIVLIVMLVARIVEKDNAHILHKPNNSLLLFVLLIAVRSYSMFVSRLAATAPPYLQGYFTYVLQSLKIYMHRMFLPPVQTVYGRLWATYWSIDTHSFACGSLIRAIVCLFARNHRQHLRSWNKCSSGYIFTECIKIFSFIHPFILRSVCHPFRFHFPFDQSKNCNKRFHRALLSVLPQSIANRANSFI